MPFAAEGYPMLSYNCGPFDALAEISSYEQGVYQTMRTCGTTIVGTKPVTSRALAKSREITVGIDNLLAMASVDGECTQGEVKWTVDSYGQAYTHGMYNLQ